MWKPIDVEGAYMVRFYLPTSSKPIDAKGAYMNRFYLPTSLKTVDLQGAYVASHFLLTLPKPIAVEEVHMISLLFSTLAKGKRSLSSQSELAKLISSKKKRMVRTIRRREQSIDYEIIRCGRDDPSKPFVDNTSDLNS